MAAVPKFEYEIYMPAGHEDWLGEFTPLAATDDYNEMMHYVWYYHTHRQDAVFSNPEGPIEVRKGVN